jgi:hypothetical protein
MAKPAFCIPMVRTSTYTSADVMSTIKTRREAFFITEDKMMRWLLQI